MTARVLAGQGNLKQKKSFLEMHPKRSCQCRGKWGRTRKDYLKDCGNQPGAAVVEALKERASTAIIVLKLFYVLSLQSFGPSRDVELDTVSLVKRLEAFA